MQQEIDSPEYHHIEEFVLRSHKLQEIRAAGIEPYPPLYKPSQSIQALNSHAEHMDSVGHSDDAAAGTTEEVRVAGRIMLFRSMGKNAFLTIQEGASRIQIMFNREQTLLEGLSEEHESSMKFLEKKLDLGDWIGVEGHLFRTMKGELTVFAKRVSILSKALLPLPEKHAGLQDKGVRYRKRWLDLITNSTSRQRFVMRSQLLKLMRNYMDEHHFMEVETPILQNSYGGAAAKPFITHLNALNSDMFLRISLEPSLKKLIVGGFERVYEVGKVFRNEGIDRTHNPEFTLFEAYASYWDYQDMMSFTENMIAHLVKALHGTTVLPVPLKDGRLVDIDFAAPWQRLSMTEAIYKFGGHDVERLSDEELRRILKELQGDTCQASTMPRGLLIAELFEEVAEAHLIQPHHIIDHPIETTPLCKPHRDPALRRAGFVERFESFVAGAELANAYSELNDPELQRALLQQQAEERLSGNEEACPMDEDFMEAICQGMPPTGGVGIGIDRLVILLTGAESIRDILLFPLMRPEEHS